MTFSPWLDVTFVVMTFAIYNCDICRWQMSDVSRPVVAYSDFYRFFSCGGAQTEQLGIMKCQCDKLKIQLYSDIK